MDISKLKTDGDLEVQGVWLKFGDPQDETDKAELRIASENSPAFKRAMRTYGRQVPRHLVADSPEALEWITKRAMADAILLESRGFTNAGKPIGNSLDERRMLLDLPPIRDFVAAEMQRLSNHQKAADRAEDQAAKEP